MPLSEQEQRLLDEMERHLLNKDADVVAPREGQSLSYRNLVYGAVIVLVGLGALLVGLSTGIIAVGVVAFVVMLGGIVLALTPARGSVSSPDAPGSSRPSATRKPTSSASFMDRMNDRWDKRQEDR